MENKEKIRIISNKRTIELNINQILYVQMGGNWAFIHTSDGHMYQTRITLSELEKQLGNRFVKANRGCLVSVLAIHNVTDTINLCNGESLGYVIRKKKEILHSIQEKQEDLIGNFEPKGTLDTKDQYHEYYRLFDNLPIAFADIEMVFDRGIHAVDWIFRYGNLALADLEKVPLEKLIGSSFGSLFPNMDSKWLRSYERAALYGETLKIIDYSPEIDTYLEVICFPTFQGHCGCMLFDVSKMQSSREITDSEKALAFYFQKLVNLDL